MGVLDPNVSSERPHILRHLPAMEARDYKTSDEVTTPDESAFQVTLYTLGLRNIGIPISKACIATLEQAMINPVVISDEKISAAKKSAETATERIVTGNFHATPGSRCKGWDYSKICKDCKR